MKQNGFSWITAIVKAAFFKNRNIIMKNLLLPFVVVALFALGSCNDTTINPPGDKKDTTKNQDTAIIPPSFQIYNAEIFVTKLPAITENRHINLPWLNTKDTVQNPLTYFYGCWFNKSKSLYKKNGDTLFFIDTYTFKSSDVWSEQNSNDTLAVVLDTNTQLISYFHFYHTDRKYDRTGNSYQWSAKSQYEQHTLTLQNINYSKTDSTINIKIFPNENQLDEITYLTESATSSTTNNGKTVDTKTNATQLLTLLPFTPEFSIEIKLRYQYK